MKKLLTTLLLLLLLSACDIINPPNPEPPAVTRTLPVWGYHVIGLAKYCDTYLNAPNLPGVSVLMEHFGEVLPCVEQKVKTNTITDVVLTIRDGSCKRNKNCPPGTPPLNDLSIYKTSSERIANYQRTYPKVNWWVSAILEHDEKNATELKKYFDIIQAACPGCKLLNQPLSGTELPGIPTERHGTKVSAFSVSGDGASAFQGDNIKEDGNSFQHRISGSEMTFFWHNSFNLRADGEHVFVPINKRTHRPRPEEFVSGYKIFTTVEDVKPTKVPAQCRRVSQITSPEIHKVRAEEYANGVPDDGRGGKPMLIITRKGKRGEKLNILNQEGNVIGCYAYYGPYSDKRLHRYYSGSCNSPNKNSWELYTANGSREWAYVDQKDGSCKLINVLRRTGVYR